MCLEHAQLHETYHGGIGSFLLLLVRAAGSAPVFNRVALLSCVYRYDDVWRLGAGYGWIRAVRPSTRWGGGGRGR
jgi:hypothetical protein